MQTLWNFLSGGGPLLFASNGKLRGYRNPVTNQDDPGFSSTIPILIDRDTIINTTNVNDYDGATLEFTGAFTVTIGLVNSLGFGFAVIPPAAGNATIASGHASVLLNGATTSITRAAASNAAFSVIQRASDQNSYVVTGS